MREDLRRILDTLDHKNQITIYLQRDAISMVEEKLSPSQFLDKIKKERENYGDCLRCNGRPFCCFFLAFAHLKLEDVRQAKLQVTEAIEGFSIRGINWNQAMSHWLLGMILLQEGKNDSAEHSLQKALGILVKLLEDFKLESNYQRAQKCEEHISHIQKALRGISDNARKKTASPVGPVPAPDNTATHSEASSTENTAFITIPWIPVYKQVEVEASSNGPIWVKPDIKGKSELAEVYIEGTCHTIHAVRHSDKRMSLTQGKQYGWVKVHGQSMNNAKPTPIQDDDFVLFYESDWPDTNEIVIVSRIDSSSVEDGLSYMVKQYSKEEWQLKSETSMRGAQYDPVNITEDYQCLGTVIAVAKPQK
jgi:tetratricopeptide (TPR) repeat protein